VAAGGPLGGQSRTGRGQVGPEEDGGSILPRLKKILADGIYNGGIAEWAKRWAAGSSKWSPIPRKRGRRPGESEEPKKFEVLPWRWIVERTFAWLGRYQPDEQGLRGFGGVERILDLHRHDPSDAPTS